MGRKEFFLLVFSLAILNVISAQNRPNVVIIMTDDQGPGDFGFMGHPYIKTPNLDDFYSSSIYFSDFHVAPVCTPTRSQILTGKDALHNGAFDPTGQHHILPAYHKLLPEYFKEQGYTTALYGKWHLGGNFPGYRPHERGFDDAVHYLRGGHWSHPNPWNSDAYNDSYYHNGRLEPFKGYANDIWFDLGKDFIKKSIRENKPYFLYLPVNDAHIPWLVREKFKKPYRNKGLDEESITFFGMISEFDQKFGEFIEFLTKTGQMDNTILVFLSDNGSALRKQDFNAGLRGKKASPYEGGHRTPLLLKLPSILNKNPSKQYDQLLQAQDLFPTLLSLCKIPFRSGANSSGKDFSRLLDQSYDEEWEERILVAQYHDVKYQGAIMHQKFRLVNGNELYDLTKDPSQNINVIQEYPVMTKKLKAWYNDWWKIAYEHTIKPAPIFISEKETVKLTAYDWYDGQRVYNFPHLREGQRGQGKYLLMAPADGMYIIELRRWPREIDKAIHAGVEKYTPFDSSLGDLKAALPISDKMYAELEINGNIISKQISKGDKAVSFEVPIQKGELYASMNFATPNEKFGAYYVYIDKKSD